LKRIVVDASVALKWYLDDEEHGQKALGLLDKYISDELVILAPSLLGYELINGLIIAGKRGRIKEENILKAIDGFMNLEIELKNMLHLYPKMIEFCKTYNRSAYDASYLAVAGEDSTDLITSDEGLYNAVKNDLKWVKWLGDI
jgi:predicted nucleic acid-binding protein